VVFVGRSEGGEGIAGGGPGEAFLVGIVGGVVECSVGIEFALGAEGSVGGVGGRAVGFGGAGGAAVAVEIDDGGGVFVRTDSFCESADVEPFSVNMVFMVLLVVEVVSSAFAAADSEVAECELSLLGLGFSSVVLLLTSATASFLGALVFLVIGADSSAGLSLECKVRPIPGDSDSLPASLTPGLAAFTSPADISTHLLPLLLRSCVLIGSKDSLLALLLSIAKGFNGKSRGLRVVAAGLLARLSFSTLIFRFSCIVL